MPATLSITLMNGYSAPINFDLMGENLDSPEVQARLIEALKEAKAHLARNVTQYTAVKPVWNRSTQEYDTEVVENVLGSNVGFAVHDGYFVFDDPLKAIGMITSGNALQSWKADKRGAVVKWLQDRLDALKAGLANWLRFRNRWTTLEQQGHLQSGCIDGVEYCRKYDAWTASGSNPETIDSYIDS